ncbi:alpha/beta fold hydrolase [candidate division CSSED10-310 bacterium]|uniref:Alpha/beta fold hydrolase n=1 Tax=candidate division CSSED10-310 bacterium TaxID=2855610 RepID=A0ABV6YTF8_UNCC1
MTTLLKKKFLATSYGKIAYLETGNESRPPVLFIHGIPTSSYLWRHVMRVLQGDFHCFAPDLMGLGDTEVDPDRDLFHMNAQAEMLLEFMTILGHKRFSLVCHDQGGAAAQILMARHGGNLVAAVLTDCVCYDNWPVPLIARYQKLARLPFVMDILVRTGIMEGIELRTAFSGFRRGVHQGKRISNESISEYLRPLRQGPSERQRFMKFLLAGHPRYTQQIVPGLKEFEEPTLVIWAADDRYISPSWGKKLFEDIPGAKAFEVVPFCGHFWQEDRPAEFTSLIGDFLKKQYLTADNKTKKKKSARIRPQKKAGPKNVS